MDQKIERINIADKLENVTDPFRLAGAQRFLP
jgi:hypothetical protein